MSTSAIEKQWEGFEKKVLPMAASDVQRTEMKRAFFAGVTATMMVLTRATNIDEQTSITNGIFKEINDFSTKQILMDRPAVGGD